MKPKSKDPKDFPTVEQLTAELERAKYKSRYKSVLRIPIEIILFDTILQGVLEERIDLGRLKTGKGYIKIRTLQIGDQKSQLVLIPVAGDFVEGNVGFIEFPDGGLFASGVPLMLL